MSIQSEINRISGNVSDALDAIEDKGVTIPSGANSDDLADLIAQITGGGTGVGGITQDQNGYLVLSPDGGGGGGGGIPWFGVEDAELLYTANYEVALSQTNYASLTPSTTAQNLTLPATTYSDAGLSVVFDRWGVGYHDGYAIDTTENDVIIVIDSFVDYKYTGDESTMGLPHVLKSASTRINYLGFNTSLMNNGEVYCSGRTRNQLNRNYGLYRDSSNRISGGSVTSYGISISPQNEGETFSASTGLISSYNLYAGTYGVRANATFMDVNAFQYLDATNTKVKTRYRLYKVKVPGTATAISEHINYILNNNAFPTD